jgi:hypothetical protein
LNISARRSRLILACRARSDHGILIGHADEHVDVTVADPENAKDLGVDEGSARVARGTLLHAA